MRKKIAAALMAAVTAMASLSVTAFAEGNVLKFALTQECETLDPGTSDYLQSSAVIMNLFMGLYMTGQDGITLTNGCAESYDLSEDGLTYTFHLYDDLLWSDGTPLTAHDFEYSWLRVLDPALASGVVSNMYMIKNAEAYNTGKCEADEVGITAVDDTTLVVELENPTSYFIDVTAEACYCPVQQAAVEASATWSQKADTYVCNGAFKVSEINPEESYILTKNENYKYADTISLDETDIVFIADGSATLTALKNGEIDMTNNISSQAQAEFDGSDQLMSFATIGTCYYDFNCEHLTDTRVRKALSLAIDRDTITQNLIPSKPVSSTGFIPYGISYNDSEEDFRTTVGDLLTFDKDTAKSLLDEAVADGFDTSATYTIIVKNDEEQKTVAQAMQAMWKEYLGMNFEIVTYESGTYWDVVHQGDFDVAYDGWTGDYDDPDTMLECFNQVECVTQNRWSGENAEKYDAMLKECAAMTDQTSRFSEFVEAEKLLIDESPIMPLYFRKSQLLVGTNVTYAINDTLGHTLFKYTEVE
ncbi:MAG: peptide ABC transporter substrate-binding protein [Lachnospiraceae bacterium]|nr:peptide ABC transporter substrate-binding protein [Lachnospiraceae bacterium]